MSSVTDEFARQRALDTYRVVDSLPELAFDDIARLASVLCDAPIALVSLVDRDRQWFKARVGIQLTEGKREDAFCSHAILSPEQLMEVPDATKDPRFVDNPLVTGEVGIRFYAGMPLITPGGLAIGTVCVIDRVERTLTQAQRAGLASLARLTMNLFEAGHRERTLERELLLTPAAVAGIPKQEPVPEAPKLPAPDLSGYTIAVFEMQGLAAANMRIGHRAVESALEELRAAIEAKSRPELGDTVSRTSDSAEIIALLHGKNSEQTLQSLASHLPEFERENGLRVLWAAADSAEPGERPEMVFLRADQSLSEAKSRFRVEIAAA